MPRGATTGRRVHGVDTRPTRQVPAGRSTRVPARDIPHAMAEHYLPGRPLRTGTSTRVTVWLVMIGYWVALIYAVRWIPIEDRRVASAVLAFVPVVLTALYGRAVKLRVARYNAASAPVLAQLNAGSLALAERELTRLEAQFAWPRVLRNLATYNRALAVMRQGRHDEAIALLADADRRGGGTGIDAALAGTLAYTHALRGNVEPAGSWMMEAMRRGAGRAPGAPHGNIMAEVAVDLRRGRYAEVKLRLDNDWVALEAGMKGESLRPLRVMRAFAVAQASGVRESGAIEPLLSALRPGRPGEFAYLGASWPELARFLAAYMPGEAPHAAAS
jgi:hypothetical protein